MLTHRTLCRVPLAGVAAAAATILTVPTAAASPLSTDPSIKVTPSQQTVTSGHKASWNITASGSSVTITYGDGSPTGTHGAGTFTLTHKYAECTAHSLTDTQEFSVSNPSGSVTVKTTVTILYSGPLCS